MRLVLNCRFLNNLWLVADRDALKLALCAQIVATHVAVKHLDLRGFVFFVNRSCGHCLIVSRRVMRIWLLLLSLGLKVIC